MLSRDEIVRSLTGAWELFLDRPDALRYFDLSVDGFWRSFRAIVLVVPSYFLTVLADRLARLSDAVPDPGTGDTAFFVAKAVALGIDWVALPVLLAAVAGPLSVEKGYSAFVIARNWGSVISVAPFGAIGLLQVLGLIGMDTASYLSLAALIIVLRYVYLMARRALGAGIGLAAAIVAFDLLLSLSIGLFVDSLFGA